MDGMASEESNAQVPAVFRYTSKYMAAVAEDKEVDAELLLTRETTMSPVCRVNAAFAAPAAIIAQVPAARRAMVFMFFILSVLSVV